MSSAAQLNETSDSFPSPGTEGVVALRQLAAERLAAHRSRRAAAEADQAQQLREQAAAQSAVRLQARRDAALSQNRPDATRVRDAVAARYRESLSYREFLAAEARRALEQAQAEAEVAERSARAVAAAQRELLDEIQQWNQPAEMPEVSADGFFTEASGAQVPLLQVVPSNSGQAASGELERDSHHPHASFQDDVHPASPAVPLAQFTPWTPASLQVKLHEALDRAAREKIALYNPVSKMAQPLEPEELAELDEEIEFRRSPEFRELSLETQVIPANIIEFPRELVAPRKARPRLAEGPLRDEGASQPQLRIFEVEPEQIAVGPEPAADDLAPVWQGLLLGAGRPADTLPRMSPQMEAQLQLGHQIHAAPVFRRISAFLMDAVLIAAGFAAFAAAAWKISGIQNSGMSAVAALRIAPLPTLAAGAAATLLAFTLLYQMLFFTFNDATPGMRAARVAFCTFAETSPARKAVRRRMLATALAACPLGLGLLWTALDSDRLGWHDRMSRMYPRSY